MQFGLEKLKSHFPVPGLIDKSSISGGLSISRAKGSGPKVSERVAQGTAWKELWGTLIDDNGGRGQP